MEYNFKLTKEEADRVVQALNNDAMSLITKMQSQFQQQEAATAAAEVDSKEELILEDGSEDS